LENRTVALQDAQWALDRALESQKFSRDVFSGNGLRGLAQFGSRRPRSPEKHVRLWGLAYQLAEGIGDQRTDEFRRRRDEAMNHALTSAPQSGDYTIRLNGKEYVLIDKGNFQFTYVDVSKGSQYKLQEISKNGLPHVFFGEEDLGRVIVNSRDLKGWRALTHDEAGLSDPRVTHVELRPE
jgi:hypothetical protein